MMTPSRAFELAAREGIEPTWEVALFFPSQGNWSEEEYLMLDPGRHVEFSCGHLELQPMPDARHQDIAFFLTARLEALAAGSGRRAKIAPFPMRVWEGQYREPDVLYMSAANLGRCHEKFWDRADLVIEVLSEGNRDHDLTRKRHEYARAGIPEYWIVDPARRTITVLVLSGAEYAERATGTDGARVASATLPGFEVDVTEALDAA